MSTPPPHRPLLIYDGDCSFCRIWIDYWKQLTGDAVDYEPYQQAAASYPHIPPEQFTKSVQFITEAGTVLSGARAVFQSLAYAPRKRWILWAYMNIPGIAPIAELCYRFIARHRNGAYKFTRMFFGKQIDVPSYTLVRWLFLRALGIIYLIAFLSLGTQIIGLVGKNGILPVENYLHYVKQNLGAEGYRYYPTLVWLNSSDEFLRFLCWGGAALSVLLIAGIMPSIVSIVLWISYLSLFVAGQTFLSFQWDILLLEVGFLAIFLAPIQILPRVSRERSPSTVMVWLFRLLLFRLMFFSGLVKLTSGDQTWLNLTTLTFHYETQPIPTPVSWFAYQLPVWFHELSCVVMFAIELGAPFLIFFPRRMRLIGCGAIVFLMIMIILTGNYTFFNFLTLALCILLLDDGFLRRFFPMRFLEKTVHRQPAARFQRIAIAFVAVVVIFLNVYRITELFHERGELPAWMSAAANVFAPYCIVNHYGLFRVMTNPRYEIVIEGSNDGTTWSEYEFKYKPGDIKRSPPWIEPHQPRLDWQMWFAALGNYRNNPWFVNLCVRLLQGTPEVLDLLERNPFPEKPPLYIRAQLYEYHFTDMATLRTTGAWWRRELRGLYLPAISLR